MFHPAILGGKTWSELGEHGEHGEHGKDGKHQPHDLKHAIFYSKHRKNCECCPGHYLIVNHYSSMNVMVQVSQFVSNSQLCH